MMASAAGGMEIEEVAARRRGDPCVTIDPVAGFQPHLARELCFDLTSTGDLMRPAQQLMSGLFDAFVANDASLAEIDPSWS